MKIDAKDIFEAARMLGAFKPEKSKSRSSPKTKEEDIIAILRKKVDEGKQIEQLFKDHEKLNKKEEKKEDPKGLTTIQWMMILLGTFPITGPLYVAYVQKLFGH